MGYTSQWVMAFKGARVLDLKDWMKEKASEEDQAPFVIQTILAYEQDVGPGVLQFFDSSTKCWFSNVWDETMEEIANKAKDLGLSWMYSRVGEYPGDYVYKDDGKMCGTTIVILYPTFTPVKDKKEKA